MESQEIYLPTPETGAREALGVGIADGRDADGGHKNDMCISNLKYTFFVSVSFNQ